MSRQERSIAKELLRLAKVGFDGTVGNVGGVDDGDPVDENPPPAMNVHPNPAVAEDPLLPILPVLENPPPAMNVHPNPGAVAMHVDLPVEKDISEMLTLFLETLGNPFVPSSLNFVGEKILTKSDITKDRLLLVGPNAKEFLLKNEDKLDILLYVPLSKKPYNVDLYCSGEGGSNGIGFHHGWGKVVTKYGLKRFARVQVWAGIKNERTCFFVIRIDSDGIPRFISDFDDDDYYAAGDIDDYAAGHHSPQNEVPDILTAFISSLTELTLVLKKRLTPDDLQNLTIPPTEILMNLEETVDFPLFVLPIQFRHTVKVIRDPTKNGNFVLNGNGGWGAVVSENNLQEKLNVHMWAHKFGNQISFILCCLGFGDDAGNDGGTGKGEGKMDGMSCN